MKRREFFKNMAGITGAAVIAPLLLTTFKAQAEESRRKKPDAAGGGIEMVDPKDTTAKGVQYVEASKFPDKNCANCSLYVKTGKLDNKGQEVGGCPIFGKKQVLAKAYCISWAKKG